MQLYSCKHTDLSHLEVAEVYKTTNRDFLVLWEIVHQQLQTQLYGESCT